MNRAPHEPPQVPERRRHSGCAVCGTAITGSWLMCPRHWRLVPRHLQVDVTRTWGRFERRGSRQEGLQLLGEYRHARDAAIAAACEADKAPLPLIPTDQPQEPA